DGLIERPGPRAASRSKIACSISASLAIRLAPSCAPLMLPREQEGKRHGAAEDRRSAPAFLASRPRRLSLAGARAAAVVPLRRLFGAAPRLPARGLSPRCGEAERRHDGACGGGVGSARSARRDALA